MPHTHFALLDLAGERGQTMTETALLLALVFLIALVGLIIFSGALENLWNQLASTLPNG
jgi:Flp pilus assembly pilin Flp